MGLLYKKAKVRTESRYKQVNGKLVGGNRFYTFIDMAIVKHDIAVSNSKRKRGEEIIRDENYYIEICGCGMEGCFIHGTRPNVNDR